MMSCQVGKELEVRKYKRLKKHTLCNKMEEQVEELDEICTRRIRITRPEVRAGGLVDFIDIRSH